MDMLLSGFEFGIGAIAAPILLFWAYAYIGSFGGLALILTAGIAGWLADGTFTSVAIAAGFAWACFGVYRCLQDRALANQYRRNEAARSLRPHGSNADV
jgi:hypothetical protein